MKFTRITTLATTATLAGAVLSLGLPASQALARPLVASEYHAVTSVAHAKEAKAPAGVTEAQVIALIKKYGHRGATGVKGATGKTGAAGTSGAQGTQGGQGLQGTQGNVGAPGPTYTAGTGLTLTGNTFAVSPTAFQAPFTSGCGPYQLLVGVTQAGAVTCDFGTIADIDSPAGKSTAISTNSSSPTAVASTGVGATNYFITADVTVDNTNSTGNPIQVVCTIEFGSGSSAVALAVAAQTLAPGAAGQVPVQTWAATSGGPLALDCSAAASGVAIDAPSQTPQANITAIALKTDSTLSSN